ncbi:MAG: ABC transporter permease [Bacillota bacterium]|jgi:peptide/nickel transport system permease protein|nr:ABC transporter permease [Bacillota bacterium]HHU30420.1 ABC transporter permease [Bacillota bacterium]
MKRNQELITRKYKKRSRLGETLHRLKKNKGAMAGLGVIIAIFLVFIGSLFLDFEQVTVSNARAILQKPSLQYPFGTDHMGRNILLRVVYGSRYSLAIGCGVVAIAAFFGIFFGAVAGYYGGTVENVIMRCNDVLASIPGMLFGMVLMTTLGQSLFNLILAVGITSIPVYTKITRASVLTVRNQEYIEAARAIGLSNFRIIFTQILPNALSPVIVVMTTSFGLAIIIASGLSFVGFGVPLPHPEWGSLISAGRQYARTAGWIMTFPGVAIMLVVLAFNLMGDGLRDALDPKLKR